MSVRVGLDFKSDALEFLAASSAAGKALDYSDIKIVAFPRIRHPSAQPDFYHTHMQEFQY